MTSGKPSRRFPTAKLRPWAPPLLLEKPVGHIARGQFPGDGRVEASDLLFHQRDPLLQLLDREQREILADLVRDLFLRAIVFVYCRHRSPPSTSAKIAAQPAVVTRSCSP